MKIIRPKIGKYILDSLSIGMYNHPLMLLREYIQNSADAIDEAIKCENLERAEARIQICIDGQKRSLTIHDNGAGIALDKAWSTLHDIGKSAKTILANRGFRGIGRLGGLGYCETLQFLTKSRLERKYSISTWHCGRLRQLIKEENKLDTFQIIEEISEFKQPDYEGNREDHFFIVKMVDLQSSRDVLLNVPAVKGYLSEVAPVPFEQKKFRHATRIEKETRSRVPNYETYPTYVNREQIFKPYRDEVMLRGEKKDEIKDIEFIELKNGATTLALSWIARLKLLGSISGSSQVDGIRVRSSNILIGNKDLLNSFFRESRFNNYLIGEIYTIDKGLVPNSRRDDFEDNQCREEFYDSFIKNIGLPYSKKIRQISLERSKQSSIHRENLILEKAKNISKCGYYSENQRNLVIKELMRFNGSENKVLFDNIDNLISALNASGHYLDLNDKNFNRQEKELLKPIFEIIYKECRDKENAEFIIEKVLKLNQ